MSQIWKHAVVGVGVVGEWHVRTIPRIPNSKLVAVCDINPDNARPNLEKNGQQDLPLYTDLKRMLAEQDVDVVHVCTPSGDHLDPVTTCLQAGRNVICEKPLEVNLERIDRMLEAASRSSGKLAGIFQNRWRAANAAIRRAAESGKFGRITFGSCATPWYRTNQYYREGGWRGTWKLDGGGAIMNQSVHAVDLLQWVCGPVKTVSAFGSSLIHPEIGVEDTLAACLVFQSGAYGTLMGATSMWPGHSVRLEVGGENGTAVSEKQLSYWRFRDETPEQSKAYADEVNAADKSESTGGGSNPQDVPQHLHLRNFDAILRAWERGEDAPTNGHEARKAVAIIMALYESARKGGVPVDVG